MSINVGYLCFGNTLASKPIEINQVLFTNNTANTSIEVTPERIRLVEEMCKAKSEDAKFIFKDGVILCYK